MWAKRDTRLQAPLANRQLGNNGPMLVEKVLTSRGDTVGEVETKPAGLRSKMAHKESEANKSELRALQQPQDESRAIFRKATGGSKGTSWSGSE